MLAGLLHAVPVLAADKSKLPFYLCGGALAIWAVVLSLAIGLRRPDFPSSLGAQRGVMALTAVLVALTAITAVATSSGEHNTAAAAIGGTKAGGNVGTPAAGAAAATPPAAAAPAAGSTLAESAQPSGALAFTKPTLQAKAGHVTIVFANMAPEAHNMTISRGALVLGATPTFQGGAKTLSLTLKPGTYQFYCTVPGHRQAGMQGTLTVS